MPDVYLFPGEASPNDVRLRDPTAAPGGTTYNDSGTGQIVVAGSAVESRSASDSRTCALTVNGTAVESRVAADSRTCALVIGGTSVESHARSSASTGVLTLSGTGIEVFAPPAGPITAGGGRLIFNEQQRMLENEPIVYYDHATGRIRISGYAHETHSHHGYGAGVLEPDYSDREEELVLLMA